MTPNLTLNVGLSDDLVGFRGLSTADDLAGFGTRPTAGISWWWDRDPGHFRGSVVNGRYTNFAPRFGFAYNIDAKTVLRGGFGIFYAYEDLQLQSDV